MGSHQLHLNILPKRGLLQFFDIVPQQIEWTKYRHTDFQKKCWSVESLNPMEIVHALDKLLRRADYSTDKHVQWKTYSFNEALQVFIDHDAYLSIDSETGQIQAFVVRIDAKDTELLLLRSLVTLVQTHDWIFINRSGLCAESSEELLRNEKIITV